MINGAIDRWQTFGGQNSSARYRVRLTRPDPWLLVAVAGLLGLGMIMVFNASYFFARERYGDPLYFFWKQTLSLLLGAGVLFGTSMIPVRWFERWAGWVLGACVVLLSAVLLIGINRGGAQRWFGLGVFSLQPSEFAKISLIIYLARSLARRADRVGEFWRGLIPNLLIVGVVAALIGAQPNFSTAAILVMVSGTMLFAAGAKIWHLGALAFAVVPVGIIEIWTSPYRWQRLKSMWDPWSDPLGHGFQLIQSMIAVGTGGWTGVGLGQSKQKMLFLPEAHTDFIFSLIGEELGVVGVALVLALFALVAARGFRIALRHPDPFSSLLAFGLTLMIMTQAVVNVGVAVGILPTTGLALPFISYGGSALLGVMVEVGILTALSRVTG